MKKSLFVALGLFCLTMVASAQMTRKPTFRPDWTFRAPAPGNGTYLYVVEHGEGNTKREAMNQAIGRVFQSTANRMGQTINTDEIHRAVSSGEDYDVISRKIKIPVNKVCEFAVQDTLNYTWTMYILCQVAKAGNITVEFETCEECTKHVMFDRAMARWKQQQDSIAHAGVKATRSENAKALVASTFIPGMGQMMKHQWGKGTAFLLSEVVLFGGGTACYFLANQQNTEMMDAKSSYDDYQNSKKLKKTYETAMYVCFGVGAAIHIANMAHAWIVPDKRRALTLVPAIIPSNEYTQPTYAYGIGLQYKF